MCLVELYNFVVFFKFFNIFIIFSLFPFFLFSPFSSFVAGRRPPLWPASSLEAHLATTRLGLAGLALATFRRSCQPSSAGRQPWPGPVSGQKEEGKEREEEKREETRREKKREEKIVPRNKLPFSTSYFYTKSITSCFCSKSIRGNKNFTKHVSIIFSFPGIKEQK